ncbi:hypothetical protein EON83_07270 [bacterium]|nr:MAG: hypothetical protein EON83_07270 [bacterium]
MLKISHPRRTLLVAVAMIPVAVFFASRWVAIRRPQYIGVQPNMGRSIPLSSLPKLGIRLPIPASSSSYTPPIGGDAMQLSPDGRWLRAQYFGERMYIWDVEKRTHVACNLHQVKFSADSQTLTGVLVKPNVRGAHTFSVVLQTPDGHTLWISPPILIRESIIGVDFVGQAIQATGTKNIYLFDLKNGKLIQKSANPDKEVVAWYDGNSPISPDGSMIYTLWPWSRKERDTATKHQVRVSRVGTRTQLWSYPAKAIHGMGLTFLACSPKWEDGGKTLATIENDTLRLYDSQSGKLLLSQKNNLPAPLQSWAFTKDRSAVYLMDAKGEIFRQRLQ